MTLKLPPPVELHRRLSDRALQRAVVTFMMPAFNTERFIAEAMRSVLDQTLDDLLLHVHDDGSSDGTRAAALAVADDRCLITSGPNAGSGAVRNSMIAVTTTPLISYMDSDDVSLSDRAENQVRYLAEHPDIDLVGGALITFGPHAAPEQNDQPSLTPEDVAALLLQGTPLSLGGATVRTEVLRSVPYAGHNVAEDLDLMARMVRGGHRLATTGEPVLRYRIHGANTSLTDSRRRLVTDTVKREYHDAMLDGPGRPRFTEWMIWASEEHSPGVRDTRLMDTSLWMALGHGLDGVTSTRLDMRKVAAVAREMAVRQYVRRAGLASAAMLPLVARRLGLRPAMVGVKRGLQAGCGWSFAPQVDPDLGWRNLNTCPEES